MVDSIGASLSISTEFKERSYNKAKTEEKKYKKIQLHDILSFDFYLNRLLQREHTQMQFSQKTLLQTISPFVPLLKNVWIRA